jgi:hypothetical protein
MKKRILNFYLPLWLSAILVITSVFWYNGFLQPKIAKALITAGNTANSGALQSASSATFTETVDATGADTVLVVCAMARQPKATEFNTVNSVTYNNLNLTLARADENEAPAADTFDGRAELWYLVNPPTGAHSVVVNWAGSNTYAGASSILLKGVAQGTIAIDATGAASGTALSLSVPITTKTANAWIVDCVYSRSGGVSEFITPNASQTQIADILINSDDNVASSYKPNTTKGANTMDWTEPNDGNDWDMVAASFTVVQPNAIFFGGD